ncbi:Aste57867_538 [Aphanomyces stellatus]|uniref:Aste57867_538 protein n=1 Tax=Aphanomyces stellatus TaxID=120398 RepID=A0A485K325_9STRA|nr:hypothetical protein As57867_000537 [Aphanomyces stellatus]VFT77763.1 Aste57867_538 [Aphanomyces stellatus]
MNAGDDRVLPRAMTTRFVLGVSFPVFKRIILTAVNLLHILSSLYFVSLGYLLVHLTPFEAKGMQVYSPQTSGAIYFVVALVHISPLLHCRRFMSRLLAARRRRRRLYPRPVPSHQSRTSPSLRNLVAVTHRRPLPANVYMALAHLLELMSETWIAAQMARHLAQRHIAFAYAMVLVSNALVMTWVLLLRESGLKKTLTSFLDSCLSFLLSAGIPLFQFILPLAMTKHSANDLDWLAHQLAATRTLFFWTPLQPLLVAAPSLLTYVTLRKVEKRVRKVKWKPTSRRSVSSTSSFFPSLQPLSIESIKRRTRRSLEGSAILRSMHSMVATTKQTFTLHQDHSKLLKASVVVSVVWGLAVLVVAILAEFYREPCPPGCIYDSAPWFTHACNCIYFRWTCTDSDIDIEARLAANPLGPNLLLLHLLRCNLSRGLHNHTLAPYQALYGIRIEFSAMTEWNMPSSMLPESLNVADIRYSQLNHVPLVLRNPGPNLVALSIVGAPLGNIPPHVFVQWSHLHSLRLSATQLSEMPHVVEMSNLQVLALDANNISMIEPGLAALPQLNWIYLESNQITTFPMDLVTAKPSLHLYLNHNPITIIPENWALKLGLAIDVASTPYCNDTIVGVACQQDCSTSCSRAHWGDALCDLSCNSTECNFDNGDCAF